MRFELQILGANSAIPYKNRFPTAQIVYHHNDTFLVDCGEGAQMKMSEFKVKRGRINQIFISHLHGDHIFGLPGLINSFQLQGRKETIDIFGPFGIKKYLEQIFEVTHAHLTFPLNYHEVDPSLHRMVFENSRLEVFTIPLRHRIPCTGYLFREKEHLRNIRSEMIETYTLSVTQIKDIKNGKDLILENGIKVENELLTHQKIARRSYAYCSDTIFDESLIKYLHGVDLLYHEATYLHDKKKLADKTMHTTAKEAGTLARKSQIKNLVIGHFSSRYDDLNVLLDEAKSEFVNSHLANEGAIFEIV